jgi:His/Glu/Gln/Arg/opine family amino acid ABC transporter permease subunit
MKFDQLQDALFDVRNHKSDAAVADLPALKRLLRTSFPDMTLVGGVIKEEYVGAAARHGEVSLIRAVNAALDQMLVDGSYYRIYTQWIQEPVTSGLVARLDAVRDAGSELDFTPLAASGAASAATPTAPKHAQRISIRWDLLPKAMPLLLKGAEITVVVTIFTLLLGVTGGLFIALARIAGPKPVRALMVFYVEIVRGTPLLMQIYAIYFVLPAFGIDLNPIVAGVTALTLNAAAYISEIFRAGIESIDPGQMEAARALGMDYRSAMRWVVLPQTVRRVLPPLTNEAAALLKDSSLVSVIAVSELMRVGKEIAANTGAPTTLFLVVALMYLAMTLPLTTLVRRLETKLLPISGVRGRKRRGVSV